MQSLLDKVIDTCNLDDLLKEKEGLVDEELFRSCLITYFKTKGGNDDIHLLTYEECDYLYKIYKGSIAGCSLKRLRFLAYRYRHRVPACQVRDLRRIPIGTYKEGINFYQSNNLFKRIDFYNPSKSLEVEFADVRLEGSRFPGQREKIKTNKIITTIQQYPEDLVLVVGEYPHFLVGVHRNGALYNIIPNIEERTIQLVPMNIHDVINIFNIYEEHTDVMALLEKANGDLYFLTKDWTLVNIPLAIKNLHLLATEPFSDGEYSINYIDINSNCHDNTVHVNKEVKTTYTYDYQLVQGNFRAVFWEFLLIKLLWLPDGTLAVDDDSGRDHQQGFRLLENLNQIGPCVDILEGEEDVLYLKFTNNYAKLQVLMDDCDKQHVVFEVY